MPLIIPTTPRTLPAGAQNTDRSLGKQSLVDHTPSVDAVAHRYVDCHGLAQQKPLSRAARVAGEPPRSPAEHAYHRPPLRRFVRGPRRRLKRHSEQDDHVVDDLCLCWVRAPVGADGVGILPGKI